MNFTSGYNVELLCVANFWVRSALGIRAPVLPVPPACTTLLLCAHAMDEVSLQGILSYLGKEPIQPVGLKKKNKKQNTKHLLKWGS